MLLIGLAIARQRVGLRVGEHAGAVRPDHDAADHREGRRQRPDDPREPRP